MSRFPEDGKASKSVQYVAMTGATAAISAVDPTKSFAIKACKCKTTQLTGSNFASAPGGYFSISNATTLAFAGNIGSPGTVYAEVVELVKRPQSIQYVTQSVPAGANSAFQNTDIPITAVDMNNCLVFEYGWFVENNLAIFCGWLFAANNTLRIRATTSYGSANSTTSCLVLIDP